MKQLVDHWLASRAELRLLEEAEHPDITDSYGRLWVWRDKDLYIHDELIAIPQAWIATLGLPAPGLADQNPNYAGLCDTCKRVGS